MKRTSWPNLMILSLILYMLARSSTVAQEDDPAKAAEVFNNACRTCHSIKKDDNRLGPTLHQIVGRKAGSLPGYNYSPAMKDADFVWDEAKLARFIATPDEVVPGNKMTPYTGLSSTKDRRKIVLFLLSTRSE